MRLIDRFTTRDGSWEPNGLMYSIAPEAAQQYRAQDIPGAGAANHLFVRAAPGSIVRVNTSDGGNVTNYYVPDSGWVNHPLFHSSAYVPSRGETGPWVVSVNRVEIARGIGLPDGLHVATFLVTDDGAPQPQPARYAFQPVSDITAYELALCLPYLVDKVEPDPTVLPAWAMRHWGRVS